MACPLSLEIHHWVHDHLLNQETLVWLTTAGTTFLLIAAAEFGDKSQLVCMTLAARHRGLPVLLGAFAAFALLNLAAVVFGAAVAHWFPKTVLSVAVAVLFTIFGLMALFAREEGPTAEVRAMSGHGLFVMTFLMIFLAEFGDKTQLATVGISLTANGVPVWVGSTLALSLTSVLGIVAGRTVLQRIPLRLMHRVSGLLFLALAFYAAVSVLPTDAWERIGDRIAQAALRFSPRPSH